MPEVDYIEMAKRSCRNCYDAHSKESVPAPYNFDMDNAHKYLRSSGDERAEEIISNCRSKCGVKSTLIINQIESLDAHQN